LRLAHQNPLGGGPSTPVPEAYLLLAALATRTERVRLGAAVSPVTLRNPALLAKSVATLDVISAGQPCYRAK
jgi:alkanesulfonate monooxygenase SsuD/methylene tetrahydromethanopterin reductase-like flavin-dependent oxidoreductase (luciferase family)